MHIDGGMADYVCVPEANVAPADGITLDQAAMIEFLAIGAHAVRRANPGKDNRILVVGAGPIGIGCMLFSKLAGGLVTALDLRQDRLDFCRGRLGVDHAVPAGADAVEAAVGAHVRRLLRHRHRRDGKREVDDGGTELCRPRWNIRSGQRRARHDLLRRSRVPQARDLAARQPQRDPAGFCESVRRHA